MYNMMTVANETYKDFLKLFVNSFYERMDFEQVNNLYIYNTGLSQETVDYLKCFPKVVVKPTNINSQSAAIHDKGWKLNTYSKTRFLLDLLVEERLPVCMIDSDCIFLDNFEDLINFEKDFAVCDRDREGFSRHIGSFFFALNVEKSVNFITKWISNVEKLQNETNMKHCESPALTKTIVENDYDYQEIAEQKVSAIWPDKSSRIAHLKSDYYATTVEKRLNLPHALPFKERYI